MKILIPTAHYFPSQVGGPANTLYWFIKHLNKFDNVQTFVVSSCIGIDESESIHTNKLFNYAYGLTKYIKTNNPKTSLRFVFSSLRLVSKSDIVYLPSLFFPPTVLITLFAFLLSKKIVIAPRGQLFGSALSRRQTSKEIYIRFFRIFSKKIYWHATSEIEKETIQNYFKTKECFVIPNYIECTEKLVVAKKKQFLFLGRINPIKGLSNFIISLAENKTFLESEFIFLIAGKATLPHELKYKISLENLIEEKGLQSKIVFLGEIKGQEKERYLAESHCLVLPSYSENFGNVVLESLNQGTPVLTTTGTPWKVLAEKKSGWWVDNDVESLSKTVSTVLEQDQQSYNQYCENANRLVNDEFDIEKNVGNWLNIFTSIYNSR